MSKRFIRHPKHTYLYQDAKFGTWYFVDYADGKRVKRSLRTKSVSEAVKLSKKVRLEILNQAPIDKKLSLKGIKNPAIEDLYEAFKQFKIDSGKLKPQSLVRIYNTWDYHLKDYWGAKTLADWTQDEMLRFESWYLAERTTKYFNIKKTITSFQRWMFEKEYIPKPLILSDLDKIMAKRSPEKKAGRAYTKEEVESLLACTPDLMTKVVIMIAVMMGARKMEILSLKKADISLERQEIGFWSTKNGTVRTVAIPDELIGPLKAHLSHMDEVQSEFVFPMKSDPKKHLSSQVFDKRWVKTKGAAGIRDWNVKNAARFHDLRHTFATMTAEQGWAPVLACEVLDMNLERYDRVYTHVSQITKAKKMRAVSLNDY